MHMADNTSNRGFASMSEDKRKELASKGGQASSGSFEKGSSRASSAGKKGAEAQPTEAKRKGGEHSHMNS
jgi:general stress protein YciG